MIDKTQNKLIKIKVTDETTHLLWTKFVNVIHCGNIAPQLDRQKKFTDETPQIVTIIIDNNVNPIHYRHLTQKLKEKNGGKIGWEYN
jgi:hypothetical protein